MLNIKLLSSILLVLAVMFAQVGNVAAAPQAQDTVPPQITGITTQTTNGVTTVLVTLTNADQTTQTVRISLEYATKLGLIDSTTQQPVAVEDLPEGTIIDPNQVIADQQPEEDFNPIVEILAKFFDEEPSVVNEYHKDGFGFGVIAQAMWISKNQAGDVSLARDILDLKKNKDYEQFFLDHPDFLDGSDGNVPSNWGQFKKLLSEKHNNLGTAVSENENQGNSPESNQQGQGNPHDKKDKKHKKK